MQKLGVREFLAKTNEFRSKYMREYVISTEEVIDMIKNSTTVSPDYPKTKSFEFEGLKREIVVGNVMIAVNIAVKYTF